MKKSFLALLFSLLCASLAAAVVPPQPVVLLTAWDPMFLPEE